MIDRPMHSEDFGEAINEMQEALHQVMLQRGFIDADSRTQVGTFPLSQIRRTIINELDWARREPMDKHGLPRTPTEDDLEKYDIDYEDSERKVTWWFHGAMISRFEPLPVGEDNHEFEERLRKAGVIAEGENWGYTDTEMCCFYIYFYTKQAGKAFMRRLAAYIDKKKEAYLA